MKMNPEKYSIEDIQSKIINTCEKLYGKMDHNSYFVALNTTEQAVRNEILENIDDSSITNTKYLDMSAYILQTGNHVFIKMA